MCVMCVEIKQRLIDVWSRLQQNIVDSAVSEVSELAFMHRRDTSNIHYSLCTLS